MRLDAKQIRYFTAEDWRVLAAVEQGSRNHELVPTPLIASLSHLQNNSILSRSISNLAKASLIAKVRNAKYDGYRLAYGGADHLALHTHVRASTIYSIGPRVGVGKESGIHVCADDQGKLLILKIHRLGRISFRNVKGKRDYLRGRSTGNWMYLSKLAAVKEAAVMKALHDVGYPVPRLVAQSRHTVVMSLVDGEVLRRVSGMAEREIKTLYADLLELIVSLARLGLIHGDFNEFNIMIEEEKEGDEVVGLKPVIIDFPQAMSIDHANAAEYFDRDVACVKRFFDRRFHFVSDEPGPFFNDAIQHVEQRLDVQVEASGFSKKMAKELEKYMKETGGQDGESEQDNDAGADAADSDDEEDSASAASAQEDEQNLEGQVQEHNDVKQFIADLRKNMTALTIASDTESTGVTNPDKSAGRPPKPRTASKTTKAAGWSI